MSHIEIPLLRESAAFVARLTAAAQRFGESRYRYYHRVNWSHRYSHDFYDAEAGHFLADPESYVAARTRTDPVLADVFARTLGPRQVANVLLKVIVHHVFRILGKLYGALVRSRGERIYRKCYVDDIELVFDPNQTGVVRAVYPFPLSVRRQLRYLRYLRDGRYSFRLAGVPYGFRDLVVFALRRDVGSLRRLETRAQIRHAREVALGGFGLIQLSDEFDMGSLDLTRMLCRCGVKVVNSAHGVGKYLPIHAYPTFLVLTNRQIDYYRAIRFCNYTIRSLNVRPPSAGARISTSSPSRVNLVFLGQTFGGISRIIADAEAEIVTRLRGEFAGAAGLCLLYKPHPTAAHLPAPTGFEKLSDASTVNGLSETIFVSMFSTCQIDPNFVGRKLLVRTHLIRPEIAFDDTEDIVDLNKLIQLVRSLNPHATIAISVAAETLQK